VHVTDTGTSTHYNHNNNYYCLQTFAVAAVQQAVVYVICLVACVLLQQLLHAHVSVTAVCVCVAVAAAAGICKAVCCLLVFILHVKNFSYCYGSALSAHSESA
jgi:hypothetical protein